ncbi:MAG: UDP-3-O-(3-hydroxymyristoyl)glucosamine N-acyltransferase [Phycisphaerales bacterium]|jgi:UDP-3-O-[3-hydroxymyristoyl] glucosamine N-acyltransferase|nr:UDP-3-O-(3-hydroxymyristoyl)glucosamine N-acyltransferase [Phycisphaerales bacterium]
MNKRLHTAGSIAEHIGAVLDGPSDLVCTGCSSISEASEGDVTFMVSAKYAFQWENSNALVGIVPNNIKVDNHDSTKRALLHVENADIAMAMVLSLFKEDDDIPNVGVHPSATISPTAQIGQDIRIGPNVVIADDVVIGDRVSIACNVSIGRGCRIGEETYLHSGVVIEYGCSVGERCILNGNVVIGTDGFGYCPSADMTRLEKIPHIGNVEIGDDVEIGSNTCIDRGKFSATIIGNGTKIDNLVQIGHNCIIGKNCVISATSAISGSVKIGNWVQIAGNVGITPHCVIGDGAKIGAKSGVMHDIPAGEEWLGIPALPVRDALRQWASTRKLPGIISTLARSKTK